MNENWELPPYLATDGAGGGVSQSYGTLSYNRKRDCWVVKAEPAVTEMCKRLFPGSGGSRRGEARFTAHRRIVECKRVRAGSDVTRALALRAGDAVMHVRRVLSFAGVAAILEDIWLPGQAFKGLTAERMADYPGPTYAMFEADFGVRMVRADESLRAVTPTPEQAQLLEVDGATPLLSVERIAYTYNDVPMELRRGLYRTDTHHYHSTLN